METELKEGEAVNMTNDKLKISLNRSFLPKSIEYLNSSIDPLDMILEFYEYRTEETKSGYYVFQPKEAAEKSRMNFLKATKYEGALTTQVQFFGSISSDKSSSHPDLVELIITLHKGSMFPVLTTKIKLNNYKEVSLRFEASAVSGSGSKFYVDDSMFFTYKRHKFDHNLHPAVNGAAQAKGDKIFWTVNSHTMGCNNLGAAYEYILHRSVDHNDNKGIDTLLNDTDVGTVNIALGISELRRFRPDINLAQGVINQGLSITKLIPENMTMSEFVNNHGTKFKFIRDHTFVDSIELVGFETKKNGEVFIKLRNRSHRTVEIPKFIFDDSMFKVNSADRYLLNGLRTKAEFFKTQKTFFPVNTGSKALGKLTDDLVTLEKDLPEQYSTTQEKVTTRLKYEKDSIEFKPFEIAAFRVDI